MIIQQYTNKHHPPRRQILLKTAKQYGTTYENILQHHTFNIQKLYKNTSQGNNSSYHNGLNILKNLL